MKMKKGFYLLTIIAILLVSVTFVSAGFFDIFNKDARLAPSQDTDVAVTVGNVAPTITNVQAIPNVDLAAGTTTEVTVIFTAEDLNGASDLNSTTASASFSKAGETTRTSTPVTGCTPGIPTGNQITYTCTVTMQYYDENANDWIITVSVDDLSSATASNSATTFQVNLLRDITITPTSITFATVIQGGTDEISAVDTTITNNGNFNAPTDGDVSITGEDLTGVTTPTETIPAANFNAQDATTGTVCSAGTTLVASTATSIPTVTLNNGDGTGGNNQRDITYCLTLVPTGISSQDYTANTGGGNAWTIGI